MTKQYTPDWNERFLLNDTPWEESVPSYYLSKLLKQYTQKGQTLLEVGCGLGINARWLAQLGYQVHAIDIAENAIKKAQDANKAVPRLSFKCLNFLTSTLNQKFDIVFDKGCFHSFTDVESYSKFAQVVSAHLNDNGVWINISGNSDQAEDLESRKAHQYPRVSLRDIAFSVEPHFEILEIKRSVFGKKNKFLSWIGVFLKRKFHYENR